MVQIWPNTEILAYASPSRQQLQTSGRQKRWPLIVVRNNGQHKSADILARNLWRWDLLMWGIGNTDEILNQLVNNMCRWLESTRSGESISVQPDKTFYNYGEKVNVTVQVFDDKRLAIVALLHTLEFDERSFVRHIQSRPPKSVIFFNVSCFSLQGSKHAALHDFNTQKSERHQDTVFNRLI